MSSSSQLILRLLKLINSFALKAFAEESGMDVEELNTLNPAIKKGAIPDLRNSVELRILRSDYNSFVSNEKEILATALAGKESLRKWQPICQIAHLVEKSGL